MRQKGKRTKGIEQAHPFDGISKVNPNAAGVDIRSEEIVVCVANETTQIVKGFGNYTVDLQAIGEWLKSYHIKTVATPAPTAGAVWRALGSTGFHCLKNWNDEDLNAFSLVPGH